MKHFKVLNHIGDYTVIPETYAEISRFQIDVDGQTSGVVYVNIDFGTGVPRRVGTIDLTNSERVPFTIECSPESIVVDAQDSLAHNISVKQIPLV